MPYYQRNKTITILIKKNAYFFCAVKFYKIANLIFYIFEIILKLQIDRLFYCYNLFYFVIYKYINIIFFFPKIFNYLIY